MPKSNNLANKNNDSMNMPDFDQLVMNHQAKKMLEPIKANKINKSKKACLIKPEMIKI